MVESQRFFEQSKKNKIELEYIATKREFVYQSLTKTVSSDEQTFISMQEQKINGRNKINN